MRVVLETRETAMMWDDIYSADEYVYGKAPNDFLKENTGVLKPGNVLCIAEGEGRNSVFLAKQGFSVTAVDSSRVGLEKTEALAEENGVTVETIHCDLADFVFTPGIWDNIVSIFCHLPPTLRHKVHQGAVQGLVKGGCLLLEAYTPDQVNYGTGGPPTADLMVTLEMLENELKGLEFLHAKELVREVIEGTKHHGTASVVQFIGKR